MEKKQNGDMPSKITTAELSDWCDANAKIPDISNKEKCFVYKYKICERSPNLIPEIYFFDIFAAS